MPRRETPQSIEDEWRIAKAVAEGRNLTLRRCEDLSPYDFDLLSPAGEVVGLLECRKRSTRRWGSFPDVWIERPKVHAILRNVIHTLGEDAAFFFAVEIAGEVRVARLDLETVERFDWENARKRKWRTGDDRKAEVYKVPVEMFKPLRT